MDDFSTTQQQQLLRQAAGFIELGELLVVADRPTPPAAEKLLERGLKLLSEVQEPVRSEPQTVLLRAEALRAIGRWNEAIPLFSAASKLVPKRLEPWLGLGWCLKRIGHLNHAIVALEQGLTASPQQPILHYNLACYLSLAGNVPSAVEHLTKAIAIDRRFRDLTHIEPDFDPIRTDPRFVAVTHVSC